MTASASSEQIRFIHRDFHSVNVLYDSFEQYNVIDWIHEYVGLIESDVAHCRLNLVLPEFRRRGESFFSILSSDEWIYVRSKVGLEYRF
ncbi:phosphotransferase [Exiguobacterium sp. s193]|uniref:phosphotransferase n=1 Tax=Exiguobacterium sp. s193 TaxID=2751207 RepID=UPI00333AC792